MGDSVEGAAVGILVGEFVGANEMLGNMDGLFEGYDVGAFVTKTDETEKDVPFNAAVTCPQLPNTK